MKKEKKIKGYAVVQKGKVCFDKDMLFNDTIPWFFKRKVQAENMTIRFPKSKLKISRAILTYE